MTLIPAAEKRRQLDDTVVKIQPRVDCNSIARTIVADFVSHTKSIPGEVSDRHLDRHMWKSRFDHRGFSQWLQAGGYCLRIVWKNDSFIGSYMTRATVDYYDARGWEHPEAIEMREMDGDVCKQVKYY
jgi:hypothetical protein